MSRSLALIFLHILFLGFFQHAVAQQKDKENSLLPEIDPQDIEIRSQFKARFPGLNRQPILGFDPKPRVYQIDPNRQPFMETQDQVVANLPISEMSRPAPPEYKFLNYSPDIHAFGRAGIGSYISPEVNFWGVHHISSKSYVGGDLDYSSSDGYLDNQASSFRFLNANADYAVKLSHQIQLHLNGGAQSDFNHLFDLNSPSVSVPGDSRKDYTGFNIGGDVRGFRNTVEGWFVQANYRYFTANMDAGDLSGDINESVYNTSFAKEWAGRHINETFTAKAGIKGGAYSEDQDNSKQWLTLQAGAEYQRLFNYSTQVTADANIYYTSNALEQKVYFGPVLKLEYSLGDKLKITGKAEGKPYLKTIEQLHETNRFLNTGNSLQHTYQVDASGEASFEYMSGGTLHGGVKYEHYNNYIFYQRTIVNPAGSATPEYGFYEVGYATAHNLKLFAGLTQHLLPERFWLSGEIYVQDPKLKDGSRIPFKETWGINSSVSVRPFNKLTIEGWADYAGSRRTSRTNEKLNGFLLIGGRVDVSITDRFGAYVKMVNLLNQDYEIWQGYTERPLQIYGGVTVKLN